MQVSKKFMNVTSEKRGSEVCLCGADDGNVTADHSAWRREGCETPTYSRLSSPISDQERLAWGSRHETAGEGAALPARKRNTA